MVEDGAGSVGARRGLSRWTFLLAILAILHAGAIAVYSGFVARDVITAGEVGMVATVLLFAGAMIVPAVGLLARKPWAPRWGWLCAVAWTLAPVSSWVVPTFLPILSPFLMAAYTIFWSPGLLLGPLLALGLWRDGRAEPAAPVAG